MFQTTKILPSCSRVKSILFKSTDQTRRTGRDVLKEEVICENHRVCSTYLLETKGKDLRWWHPPTLSWPWIEDDHSCCSSPLCLLNHLGQTRSYLNCSTTNAPIIHKWQLVVANYPIPPVLNFWWIHIPCPWWRCQSRKGTQDCWCSPHIRPQKDSQQGYNRAPTWIFLTNLKKSLACSDLAARAARAEGVWRACAPTRATSTLSWPGPCLSTRTR